MWWLYPALATSVTAAGAPTLPSPPPPLHYVPLSGSPLSSVIHAADGRPAAGCVEFVEMLIELPHWRLGVVDAVSGCMGTHEVARYDIDADGRVRWSEQGLTRELRLERRELAAVMAINRLDCHRTEEVGYGERYFQIALGDATLGFGAHIPGSSTMGLRLDALLERAVERDAARRLAAMGTIRIELAARSVERTDGWTARAARYRVEVDGHTVTVHRRGKLLHQVELTDRELIDVVDWATERGPEVPPHDRDDYMLARGTLRVGDGAAIPVAIAYSEHGPLQVVGRAIDRAIYDAEQPDD